MLVTDLGRLPFKGKKEQREPEFRLTQTQSRTQTQTQIRWYQLG